MVVAGGPGSGKTGVLAQVVEHFDEAGWPTLVFRMDRLEPCDNKQALGKHLGLSSSPTEALLRCAPGAPCLIVIDQLDAVSTTSGRNTSFLDRMAEFIDDARRTPELRLVLGCRTFDLKGDYRISSILGLGGDARRVDVRPLAEEVVKQALADAGRDADALEPAQVELLREPLCLQLWITVVEQGDGPRIRTLRDLLDAWWRHRTTAVTDRVVRATKVSHDVARRRWQGVLDAVLDRMGSRRTLSAPRASFEDQDGEALGALLAEGVLVCGPGSNGRLAFPHERHFDDAFARRFVIRGRPLLEYLLDGEQLLEIRTTVRQVLEHLRDADDEAYLEALRGVLTHEQVRFHVRHLVLGWLRTVDSPMVEEWRILQARSRDAEEAEARLIRAVRLSGPWFDLLDRLGWVERGLRVDSARVDEVVGYLGWTSRERPRRVAELVRPWIDRGGDWFDRAVRVMQQAELHTDEAWVDLLQAAAVRDVDRLVGGLKGFAFHCVRRVPAAWPRQAIEIGARALESRLAAWREEDSRRAPDEVPKRPELSLFTAFEWGWHDLARLDPAAFGEIILPHVLRAAEYAIRKPLGISSDVTLAQIRDAGRAAAPATDRIWFRPHKTPNFAYGVLLNAIEEALGHIDAFAPALAAQTLERLEAHAYGHTSAYLLLRTLAASPTRANHAVRLLLDRPGLLATGYSSAPYWAARELIEAASSRCDDELYRRLECELLAYYGPEGGNERGRWDKECRPHAWRLGGAQHTLLNGLPEARRSGAARRRLLELERRFGRANAKGPSASIRMSSGEASPFDGDFACMTDADWLRAMRKHTSDDGRWDGDLYRGGAQGWDHRLRERARAEPERFALMLVNLPGDIHPAYREALLRGLLDPADKDNPPDGEWVWQVIRTCEAAPANADHWRLFDRCAERQVPDDILALILRRAESPVPAPAQTIEPEREDDFYPSMAEIRAGGTTRGRACELLSRYLFADPTRLERIEGVVERLICEPSAELGIQAAGILIPILNLDRDRAVAMFTGLTDAADLSIATSRNGDRFLRHARWTHWDDLEPLVRRMVGSDDPRVRRHGALHVSCLVLTDRLPSACLDDLPMAVTEVRAEVAATAAWFVVDDPSNDFAQRIVIESLSDTHDAVVDAAAQFLDHIQRAKEPVSLIALEPVLEAHLMSDAFVRAPRTLMRAIEASSARLPDLVLSIYERLRDTDTTNKWFDTKLLHRLYSDTSDRVVRRRCLDIIDGLLRKGDGSNSLSLSLDEVTLR